MREVNSNYVIKEVQRIVEKACSRDTNVFGYGIWTHHILKVVMIGKKFTEQFGADPEIVEIAALLHDYAGIKDHSLHKEHHIRGAIEAEKILKDLNYPEQKIEAVKHCIKNHRGSVPGKRGTPEAECLASADAIAHIENVPSLFYLAYARFDMGIEDGEDWIRKKLNRTWKKINPEIRYLVEEKYKSAINTVTKKEAQL
ncbi:MAG: HD domain-containing protein [Ignavibacteriaceae bacterium]